jgi:DNA-binding response OmpR family regulator
MISSFLAFNDGFKKAPCVSLWQKSSQNRWSQSAFQKEKTELLQYLFLSNHSIIQRKDLMNHIWGNDSFFNSRNLDVYITKLRGYLKNDPSIQIITIKGVGYRFVIGGKQL